VVSSIDAIDVFTHDGAPPWIELSRGTTLCFTAHSEGARVAGAPWSFAASAGLEIKLETLWCSCIDVLGMELGTATLTVTAGGFSADFPVEVVE
jgi:hypothetical protein